MTKMRGTKDIVDEATEAFAAYRGLGRDIIDDLIATLIDARQTIANMAAANAGMASQRDHAMAECDAAIKQRDEWMARQMDSSLQRDAYREMLAKRQTNKPHPPMCECPDCWQAMER